MGPYVEGMWDDEAPLLLSPEEDWLKSQAKLLQTAGEKKLENFGKKLELVLCTHPISLARKNELNELHKLIYAARDSEGKGGYGGHLPNQVKNHPKLRVAIWNLFARAFGLNTHMGEIFRPKSGDEVRPNFGSEDFRHPPPKPLRRYSRA